MKPTHGNWPKGMCDQYAAEGQHCSGWRMLEAEVERLRSMLDEAYRLGVMDSARIAEKLIGTNELEWDVPAAIRNGFHTRCPVYSRACSEFEMRKEGAP